MILGGGVVCSLTTTFNKQFTIDWQTDGELCHLDSLLTIDRRGADIVGLLPMTTTSQRKDAGSSGWGNWKGMLTTNSTRMQHDKNTHTPNTHNHTHAQTYVEKKDEMLEMPKRQKRLEQLKTMKANFWTDIRLRLGNALALLYIVTGRLDCLHCPTHKYLLGAFVLFFCLWIDPQIATPKSNGSLFYLLKGVSNWKLVDIHLLWSCPKAVNCSSTKLPKRIRHKVKNSLLNDVVRCKGKRVA